MALFTGNAPLQPTLKKRRLFGPDTTAGETGGIPEGIDLNNIPQPSSIPPSENSSPSLKQRLFGYSDPVQEDEYRLQKPTKQHQGILSKVLSYALPAAIGIGGGVGALPGIATAFAGEQKRSSKDDALEQAQYNKERMQLLQKPSGQKEFEYYNSLPEDQQKKYLEMKTAGSMNPLAISRFNWDVERDREAKAEKRAKDELELEVPGYERTGRTRVSNTEAAKLRDAVAQIKSFEDGIQNLKSMYDKYGNIELTGDASGQLAAAHTNLQMTLKELQNLGALSGPDMGLLLKQLGDVNSWKNLYTLSSTSAAQAQQVLDDIKTKVRSKMESSGYKEIPKDPQADKIQQVKQWIKDNPNDPKAQAAMQKLIQMGAL